MSDILYDTSDAAVIAAFEQNWDDIIRTFGRAPDVEMHDEPRILWFITGMRAGGMNGVQHARLEDDEVEATFVRVQKRFGERGVGSGWLLGPGTRPKNLDVFLLAHGLVNVAQLSGMRLDLRELNENLPTPLGLTIERVRDLATLDEWNIAEARGFQASSEDAAGFAAIRKSIGIPDEGVLRRYLGRYNGRPVATATLLISGGVAGIYDVSTEPELRRRGIGGAITLAAVRDARALGYRTAVLQPSDMGLSVYRRLGFAEFCTFSVFA